MELNLTFRRAETGQMGVGGGPNKSLSLELIVPRRIVRIRFRKSLRNKLHVISIENKPINDFC